MAGAGNAILFVVSLVGLTIFSLIYFTCAAHYFLTTVIESSAGHDEVAYPRESIIEWWWKPLFVVWVLAFWIIPVAALAALVSTVSPLAAVIVFVVALWFLFPLSMTSALVTQNWFFFVHPIVVWRMVRHYGALAYVHVLTLMAAAMCAWFLFAAWTQSFLWAIPAAFAIPTTILFYARHWGRFAWLALNFVPHSKAPAAAKKPASDTDTVPEMDVLEIEEGIRSGPPPAGDGIKASSGAGAKTMAAPTPYHAEDDEATMETKPYLMVEDPTKPNFQDAEDAPLAPAAAQSTSAAPVEEEDEWATEKKPYGLIGDADFKAPPTDAADARKPEADRPIVVGKHFDEQHAREKEKKRQAQVRDDVLDLPVPSKKTPTFADALFFGVWRFMIYERTLSVWLNLIVLTAAELFFLYMVRQFLPQV